MEEVGVEVAECQRGGLEVALMDEAGSYVECAR